jgi:molybdopterin-guanine dinucleotide biosynthesis protein A
MNAYILIGGRSRRMGTSKAGLFLDRIVTAAAPVFEEVLAVQRYGGDAASIPTIYEEPHEQDGAIFGLMRALHEARERAFVLAVDYPFITEEVLRFLRDDGRVPIWDGRPQPLCTVWEAAVLPRVKARIAEGALDLHGLIDREMIPEAELRARFPGEPLRNVNTPEEWHGQ